jgi:hypothetical protein
MANRFQTAMQIQDAVNLVAVAGEFHRMCIEVLEETHSTDAVKRDAAILWMIDKINDLVGRPDCQALSTAYDVCLAEIAKYKGVVHS